MSKWTAEHLTPYLLSLPERVLRSATALAGGLLREIGEVTIPRTIRRSQLYQNLVEATLRFLIEQVGQVGGVYPEDGRLYRGKTGVRVKVDYEDLPSTADHDVAEFKWSGGTVHGYRQGIDVGPGVNGTVTGVAIVDTKRAVHFARGGVKPFEPSFTVGTGLQSFT